MDTGTYTYSSLSSKYKDFRAPDFEITVGSTKLDNNEMNVSDLTVDITAGYEAGGCSFTINNLYDYKNSKFLQSITNTVKVGEKLSVKTGYITKKEVFKGYIDQMTVEYGDRPPFIRVEGIDAKGFLMNSNTRYYLNKTSLADAVNKMLNECVSKGYASKVTKGAISGFTAELVQNDIDDYRFLVHVAELLGLSFFVVNGEIVFDDVISKTSSIISLTSGDSLLSFSRTLSLYKQIGKVVVHSIDPKTGKSIKGEAASVSLSGTGSSAPVMVSKFKDLTETEYNYLVKTDVECKKLAQARLDARAMDFVSGEGCCLGIPELIPGRYIELDGMDSNTNGKYFISSVRHVYGDEGYRTYFGVKGAKAK